MKEVKNQVWAALFELRVYVDEPRVTWRAQKSLFAANLRYMGLALRPALWMIAADGAAADSPGSVLRARAAARGPRSHRDDGDEPRLGSEFAAPAADAAARSARSPVRRCAPSMRAR